MRRRTAVLVLALSIAALAASGVAAFHPNVRCASSIECF